MTLDLEAARKRIAELELLVRSTHLYGVGFLLKHGNEQLVLKPSDVTMVFPAGTPLTPDEELELLRTQRDKALALCDESDAREFAEVGGELYAETVREIFANPPPPSLPDTLVEGSQTVVDGLDGSGVDPGKPETMRRRSTGRTTYLDEYGCEAYADGLHVVVDNGPCACGWEA